jgi:hypothetical protein
MKRGRTYYTLVASLPALPRSFQTDRVPITWPRLEHRLKMLTPEDAEVVTQLRAILFWDRQRRDHTDEEVISHYDQFMSTIQNRLAGEIVSFRMDIRTIVSGLRRRRRGLPPPSGVGQWTESIRRNWDHPQFNLARQHSWIAEVERLLGTPDCLDVERILLGVGWKHWTRLAEQHYFDFEAVLLYLARWDILSRWVGLDATLGQQRFEQLVTESISEYHNLFQ